MFNILCHMLVDILGVNVIHMMHLRQYFLLEPYLVLQKYVQWK